MNTQYESKDIELLEGLEPVKRRPGMYTDTSRPNHLATEVIDNSVDEALLKTSDGGRAIFTTSGAAQNRRANWAVYSASKAAPGEDPETLHHPDDIAPLFVELALPSDARNGEIVRFED